MVRYAFKISTYKSNYWLYIYQIIDGTPSEKGLISDAYAVWNYVINELNVKPKDITIFGHSL